MIDLFLSVSVSTFQIEATQIDQLVFEKTGISNHILGAHEGPGKSCPEATIKAQKIQDQGCTAASRDFFQEAASHKGNIWPHTLG